MIEHEGIFEWRGERAKLLLAVVLGVLPLGTLACGDTANEIRAKMEEEQARQTQPISSSTRPKTEASVRAASLETPGVEVAPSSDIVSREVTYGEAEAAFRDRRYDKAVVLFSSYTRMKSENPWGHYMLGLSQWKTGSLAEAEASFDKALDLDPDHVKSLVNLSRVLLEHDRPEDAIEVAQRAVELDPESSDAIRQLARAQFQLGDVDGAIVTYRDALLLNEEDAWSMNNLGFALIREDRFEEAIGPLARAVEVRQDVPLFFNNLGMALERTGHLVAAREVYRQAVTLDEIYTKARGNLQRVESVEGAVDTGIDLAQYALRFTEDIAVQQALVLDLIEPQGDSLQPPAEPGVEPVVTGGEPSPPSEQTPPDSAHASNE